MYFKALCHLLISDAALASQPKALAPNTAASLSFNSERSSLTLPLNTVIVLRSIDSLSGFISKSPDFAKPPKRIMARECDEICQRFSQDVSGKLKNIFRKLIT